MHTNEDKPGGFFCIYNMTRVEAEWLWECMSKKAPPTEGARLTRDALARSLSQRAYNYHLAHTGACKSRAARGNSKHERLADIMEYIRTYTGLSGKLLEAFCKRAYKQEIAQGFNSPYFHDNPRKAKREDPLAY